MPKSLASAIRISILYCIFSALWIVFSDKALEWLIHDVALMSLAQTVKGWFFVAVTSALLFILVSNSFNTIESLNQVDGLTGLVRYYGFKQELDTKIRNRQADQVVLVMYLDFVNFAALNQSLGFEAADRILSGFAKRLQSLYSADVSLGRLGPDQFSVALTIANDNEKIEEAINQLRQAFDTNARVKQLDLSCAMGVAIEPNDGHSATLLMSAAANALGKAKNENSGVQFFNKELSKQESERQALLQDLRQALKDKALSVVYQPQYDLDSESVTGVEVLVRWQHPVKGYIPPDVFVELAEENNLCHHISAFVIHQAEKELGSYNLLNNKIPRVSINISAVEFNSTILMDKLIEQINLAPRLSKHLQIEITETAALDNVKKSIEIISHLKSKNICFSIDDFGTGYTSLVILRDLPVDEIKIDRSFISCIEQDKKSRAIVESIITMTKGFDMTVVAEGVETQEQQILLSHMQCNQAQGYLLAMPMDIKTLSYHLNSQ